MQFSTDNIFSLLIVFIILIGLGCTATEQTTTADSGDARQDTAEVSDQQRATLQATLDDTRSKLSDVYPSQKHDMPESFLQQDSSNQSLNDNPFDGYRVQIISTRDQPLADSVAHKFRMWSDSTITGYTPRAYVSFRQPFYKVHIGDFQQREQANKFSKLIKRKYPDAWVVHDRINPANTPADTTSFSIRRKNKQNTSDR